MLKKNKTSFYRLFILSVFIVLFTGCKNGSSDQTADTDHGKNKTEDDQRFFSDKSFWNQPIGKDPETDPNSDKWIRMLESEPTGENFSTSFKEWTVPVYEVEENTKYITVKNHYLSEKQLKIWIPKSTDHFAHGPDFNPVPIPENSSPDKSTDAHYAVVDRHRMLAWDMWGLRQLEDGSWESNTGMFYRLDGMGVFSAKKLGYVDDESVHFHGPSRAAGVPVIAGLIMYDEVMAGEIRHKLSCATRFAAKQTFVYPASWTDGYVEGGIPEGAVIQLDPDLDLSQFELTREEKIIATAMQVYGMVVVDIAQGQPVYAEGLWGHPEKSWEGKLHEWEDRGINAIPFKHYRILKIKDPVHRGDIRTSMDSFKEVWLPDAVEK
jgi:hypothetical protein